MEEKIIKEHVLHVQILLSREVILFQGQVTNTSAQKMKSKTRQSVCSTWYHAHKHLPFPL